MSASAGIVSYDSVTVCHGSLAFAPPALGDCVHDVRLGRHFLPRQVPDRT